LFAHSRIYDLGDVFTPQLLLAAASQLSLRPVVQLEGPALHVLKIHQRVRILLALGQGEFVRLLANLLPGVNLVDGGQGFLRLRVLLRNPKSAYG
jgi:hypothetical protein